MGLTDTQYLVLEKKEKLDDRLYDLFLKDYVANSCLTAYFYGHLSYEEALIQIAIHLSKRAKHAEDICLEKFKTHIPQLPVNWGGV